MKIERPDSLSRLASSVCVALALVLGVLGSAHAQNVSVSKSQDAGWPNYGNDPGGQRYSPLAQVNRDNVAQLKVAWTYRTGVLEQLGDLKRSATFEATPILVDGRLYLSTALDHVIALEPDTGKKIWEFDPKIAYQSWIFGSHFSRSLGVERSRGKSRRALRVANIHWHH